MLHPDGPPPGLPAAAPRFPWGPPLPGPPQPWVLVQDCSPGPNPTRLIPRTPSRCGELGLGDGFRQSVQRGGGRGKRTPGTEPGRAAPARPGPGAQREGRDASGVEGGRGTPNRPTHGGPRQTLPPHIGGSRAGVQPLHRSASLLEAGRARSFQGLRTPLFLSRAQLPSLTHALPGPSPLLILGNPTLCAP